MGEHNENRDTDSGGIPRRTLLKASAVASGAAFAATWGTPLSAIAGSSGASLSSVAAFAQGATPVGVDDYSAVALTADEATQLRAVCNRLIPTDDLGPGAGDAGAHIYIDRALAGPGAAILPMYQAGLAALNAGAEGDFVNASEPVQDEVLVQAEAGELADSPEGFFGLLLEHTRQGMFGDPMYGGNVDFAGWDLIQYPGLKLLYTADEQEIGTVIEPAHRSVAEQGGVPYEPAS